MIHIDQDEDWKGSLSSITFTEYGSTTAGSETRRANGRKRTESSDAFYSDDDERYLQRANAMRGQTSDGADGPALPPRPPRPGRSGLQQPQQKRKGHRRPRASTQNELKGERNRGVKIEFPDAKEGVPAPGNFAAEPLIEQGDLDCAYMCTCVLLLLFLPLLVYFFTNLDENWRLHTGASRHVVVSTLFTKSISIDRTPPTQEHGHENEQDSGGLFEAYHVDGACPPLTGPELLLDHKRSLHLDAGMYDWNRYYLNPQSVLNVTVTARSGGIKLFLFRGRTAFESWRRDPSEYTSFFRRSHTYEGLDPATIFHEAVIAEAFYVVYSNSFNWGSDVDINVERKLTTFNLTGVEPLPDDECTDEGTKCFVELELWKVACIVVQAKSPKMFHNGTSIAATQSYTSDYAVGELGGRATNDAIVYVSVDGHHRWTALVILFVTPALLLLLNADSEHKDDESSTHPDNRLKEDTAPAHQSSEETPLVTNPSRA